MNHLIFKLCVFRRKEVPRPGLENTSLKGQFTHLLIHFLYVAMQICLILAGFEVSASGRLPYTMEINGSLF